MQNYKTVTGIIYYNGSFLKIAPDTEYWKYFYGPDSEEVLYGDIGLWEDLTFLSLFLQLRLLIMS